MPGTINQARQTGSQSSWNFEIDTEKDVKHRIQKTITSIIKDDEVQSARRMFKRENLAKPNLKIRAGSHRSLVRGPGG